MVNFEPTSDRVLVIADKPEERTESGVIIPGSARPKSDEAVVAAVGPDCEDILVEGVRIKHMLGAGSLITIDDVEYLILREEQVLGILI